MKISLAQSSFEKSIRGLAKLIVIGAIMLPLGSIQLFAKPLPQETQEIDQPAQAVRETPAQLQQLVAPIALYPDELVAQILIASTYPTEIVDADRWLQLHSNLQGEQLAAEVDQQLWDSSVKALTAFPSVVSNLDKNLSWTTALGEAYFYQQQDVLDAAQIMRRRAQNAGNLQSTPEQRVSSQGSTIVIEPVSADTCYLPIYDPWIVYGAPIDVYPGYVYDPWYGPPYIVFGPAIGLGFFGRFGWGWPAWAFNWGQRVVVLNRVPYVSRSRFFFHNGVRTGPSFRSFGGSRTFRGFGQAHPQLGLRSGGFRSAHARYNSGGMFHAGRGFGGGGFRGSGRHR